MNDEQFNSGQQRLQFLSLFFPQMSAVPDKLQFTASAIIQCPYAGLPLLEKSRTTLWPVAKGSKLCRNWQQQTPTLLSQIWSRRRTMLWKFLLSLQMEASVNRPRHWLTQVRELHFKIKWTASCSKAIRLYLFYQGVSRALRVIHVGCDKLRCLLECWHLWEKRALKLKPR